MDPEFTVYSPSRHSHSGRIRSHTGEVVQRWRYTGIPQVLGFGIALGLTGSAAMVAFCWFVQ
jgi:hypothetical protein